MHLPGFYHLVQLRVEWISLHITISQAMGSMRSTHTKCMHLPGFYHLVQLRVEWISLHIHNVYPIRTQAWDNQPAPRSGGVIITRTASIPSHVVYLISKVRKVKTRYHCRVSWTVWVNIHSGNIVRIVLTRYNAREVQYLLSRGGEECISWCG